MDINGKNNNGFVYLLLETDENGNEKYKIGVTKRNIEKRIRELQTGNSNKISVINHYESKNYKKVEKWLHGRYLSKKTLAQNEWFNLTSEDVLGFLDECKKAEAAFDLLRDNPFFK
jgi:hypothetical protein